MNLLEDLIVQLEDATREDRLEWKWEEGAEVPTWRAEWRGGEVSVSGMMRSKPVFSEATVRIELWEKGGKTPRFSSLRTQLIYKSREWRLWMAIRAAVMRREEGDWDFLGKMVGDGWMGGRR